MNEGQYQRYLIRKIREILPGCIILINDARSLQGIPDILILYQDKWAMLEVKMSVIHSDVQPNQRYYVDLLDDMSFASFISPENEEDILYALQQSFQFVR